MAAQSPERSSATEIFREPAFRPYIPPEQEVPEFSFKAIFWGVLFGVIFGAVTVYLGLRAGLTVSASIPIAVLSISILRALGRLKWFGRPTILENNIVQTTGSAGESIAAGVVFTLPALIFLGFRSEFEYWRIFFLALVGGWLGVLFMIPLRRYLIVKEHGQLKYPEGQACADVLVAGEKGGSMAGKVFAGLGLGAVYKLAMGGARFWPDTPTWHPRFYPGGTLAGAITPEYLGVGYIIGARVAGTLFAGGVLSWLVLIPLIKFFGQHIPEPIFPATARIADLSPLDIWRAYIRSIGAGAVAAAGTITLGRTIPTIVASFRSAVRDLLKGGEERRALARTDRDIPLVAVAAGSLALMLALWGLLALLLNPGSSGNFFSSILLVVFGFIFVTVSSRIVGLIGTSANPISGMTIATLIAVCLIFMGVGWTGGAYAAVALSVGGVVCIAAANAGATSQDLKTGFLVGATPYKQQLGLMIGATFSVLAIGGTMILLNRVYTKVQPANFGSVEVGPEVKRVAPIRYEGKTYTLVNVIGSRQIPDGEYLLDEEARAIRFQQVPGIGSQEFPAPQATLMATVINGILTRKLQWGLVLFGIFIVVTLELCGVRSLAFAVGSYLPISTTAPIFFGGVVKYLVEKIWKIPEQEAESGSGALFAAGLIAGGSIGGLILAATVGFKVDQALAVGPKYFPGLADSTALALMMFLAMATLLFFIGRKRLELGERR